MPDNSSIVALTAETSPLAGADWLTISFYGDSITWLDLYEQVLAAALADGPGTANVSVRIINQGVDGGTARDLVIGYSPWGHLNPWLPQTNITYVQTLDQDMPDIVAIQIGINDVWQAGPGCGARCSNVTEFVSVLRDDLITPAQSRGARVYLASVSTIGEMRNGTNAFDANLTAFAAAARGLAQALGVPFVDLRDADETYLTTNNCMDLYSGVITYDGVHPNAFGARNLANMHAGGIVEALRTSPVPPRPLPPGVVFGGRAFLTAQAYSTALGGIAGADAVCTREAGVPARALLVDEAGCAGGSAPCRRATLTPFRGDGQIDWPLCPHCAYFNWDNTTLLGLTDATALFAFPLFRNSMRCVNQASGMQTDWTTVVNGTCASWTAGSNATVVAATAHATVSPSRAALAAPRSTGNCGAPRARDVLNALSIGWSCAIDNGLLYGGAEHWPCDSTQLLCVTDRA